MSSTTLDQQFAETSEKYDIGVAKLKAVYFRGIEEYHSSAFDMGTPTTWGLARVQRFINCVSTGASMTTDRDLVEIPPAALPDAGVNISVDASALIADVLYSDGARIAALFAPAQVTALSFEDDVIDVDGTLDGQAWRYSLNTASGEQNMQISGTVSP